MIKYYKLITIICLIIVSACNKKSDNIKKDEVLKDQVKLGLIEKLDSIQIEYLGNPYVHDIDPKSGTVIFKEYEDFSNDIYLANFDGQIFNSLSKFGDVPDGYGKLISRLQFTNKEAFIALGLKGFLKYDFEGNLIDHASIDQIEIPNFQKNAMGHGMVKLGEMYLTIEGGTRAINYDKIQLHSDVFLFNLFDPVHGTIKPIIQFPETSIYKSGKTFYRHAWSPVFTVVENQILVAFGGEPVIYHYNSEPPFELISSIPLKLKNYNYFEGQNSEYLEHNFFDLFKASGRVENIKKFEDKFIVAYFQGYDKVDKEYHFAKKTPDESKELRKRLEKKYPFRLAIFDSLGNLLKDFVPSDYDPSSMLIRDGQLWVMGKPDPDVEKDYFKLYRIGFNN